MTFDEVTTIIEKNGLGWLARTDEGKGYFVHVFKRSGPMAGDYEISCKAYSRNLVAALWSMYNLAKDGTTDVLTDFTNSPCPHC